MTRTINNTHDDDVDDDDDVMMLIILTRAYVRQGEYGLGTGIESLDPDSGFRLLPKFNRDFPVQGYICDKVFMKIRSLSPEI